MRGSVWARNITSCLVAFSLVGVTFLCILVAIGGIPGQKIFIGPYVFTQAALEPWSARVYVLLMLAIGGAMAIASLFLMRSVFNDLSRRSTPQYWAADGVHPTPAGHAAIAEQWRRAAKL